MIIISLTSALLPVLLFLFFIWKFDKNEPEPIKFVLLHFLYGATGAIILGIVGSEVISIPVDFVLQSPHSSLYKTIIIAPIIEEIAKALYLFKNAANKNVDNLTDGLVYGSSIGLGFGMTENFLYFLFFSQSMETLLPLIFVRTFFTVIVHAISTATVGGFIANAKFLKKRSFVLSPMFGLTIAILIHLTWNYLVSTNHYYWIGILFVILILILFFVAFRKSLQHENRIIFNNLQDEIPNELLKIISSNRKFKKDWFINSGRKQFVKTATKLAFRKHEVEISETIDELYIYEINVLRNEINNLLSKYDRNNQTS